MMFRVTVGAALLISACSALTTVTFHDLPDLTDNGTAWRPTTCVRTWPYYDVEHTEGVTLKSESDQEEVCVLVFNREGCEGTWTEVKVQRLAGDDADIFRRSQSMSPCGSYQPDPEVTQEVQFQRLRTFNRRFKDSLVSVYVDSRSPPYDWFHSTIPSVLQYTRETYGPMGSSNSSRQVLLYFVQLKSGNGNYRDLSTNFEFREAYRSALKILSNDYRNGKTPGRMKNQENFEHILRHFGCLVFESSNNVYSLGVANNVWDNHERFGDIFTYDILLRMNMTREAEDFKNRFSGQRIGRPRPYTYWFRDWMLPLYEQFGGARVFSRFMRLMARDYPKRNKNSGLGDPVGREYSRRLNVGEFVHFFSGAARRNLKDQATKTFGWDNDKEAEFQRARRDFPRIKYSD